MVVMMITIVVVIVIIIIIMIIIIITIIIIIIKFIIIIIIIIIVIIIIIIIMIIITPSYFPSFFLHISFPCDKYQCDKYHSRMGNILFFAISISRRVLRMHSGPKQRSNCLMTKITSRICLVKKVWMYVNLFVWGLLETRVAFADWNLKIDLISKQRGSRSAQN